MPSPKISGTQLGNGTSGPRRQAFGAVVPDQLKTSIVLFIVWLALMAVTGVSHPGFLSSSTFLAIAFGMMVPGFVALGLSFVTISGALLDLSSAAVVAISSVVCAAALVAGVSTPIALLLAVLAGAAVGACNAGLVVGVGINPIVATLATSLVGGGLLVVTSGGTNEYIPGGAFLRSFANGRILGVPDVLIVLVILFIVAELALTRTRFGLHMVAVGGNKDAARSRGISVKRVRVTAFILSGVLAGFGGAILAGQATTVASSVDPQLAYRVAAVVLLGGISLSGGRGRVAGMFASLLLLSSIPTAIVQFGLPSSWQNILEGAALFVAVIIDARRYGRSR